MYISGFGDGDFSIMAYSAVNNMGTSFITGDGLSKKRITKDGNVGTGITSPSHKLEVDGDIKFTGTLYEANGAFSNYNDANRLNNEFLKEPVAESEVIENIQEPTIIQDANIQEPTSSPSVAKTTISGTEYKHMPLHTTEATNTPYTITFNENIECDILIVGGGGTGGNSMGGGGGAGGVVYTLEHIMNVSYTVGVFVCIRMRIHMYVGIYICAFT